MSKKEKNNKKKYVQKSTRADGVDEYTIREAPQRTLLGKIIIIILCAGLALSGLIGLIFVLAEL